ncbi:MAG: L-glutamate gamma-semialdehyde dehydrogenase [Geobacter sp.]|nr:L-glutamate gamma-semialdehyde dehydrogenase [Geobacter sp.]
MAPHSLIQTKGMEIFRLMEREKPGLFDRKHWIGELMSLAMENADLKVRLFRFVDVLPTLTTTDLVTQHIREYFLEDAHHLPPLLKTILKGLDSPLTAPIEAALIRKNLVNFARTFMAGESAEDAIPELKRIWRDGRCFTVDILGEAALSNLEAEEYQSLYLSTAEALAREIGRWPPLDEAHEARFPRLNLSVKASSLFPRIGPLNYEESVERTRDALRPIFRMVRELEGVVNLDMEMFSLKNITLDIFTSLLEEKEFSEWDGAGIALQAYLKETRDDINRLAEWARKNRRNVTVRLVKGAYWEYETITAQQKGWPVPVFTEKNHTDWHFEQCMELILDNRDALTLAIGSHNIRSIAATMAATDKRGLSLEQYEFQMLYGMAEPVKHALRKLGHVVRDYSPIGELVPGMAYLVRRLLENTSNEGFLRKTFAAGASPEELLAEPEPWQERPAPPAAPGDEFANEPLLDFSRMEVRDRVRKALARVNGELGRDYPLIIGGREVAAEEKIASVNPASPAEVVGRMAACTRELAEEAVAAALEAQPAWEGRPPLERAEVLLKAAKLARRRRHDLLAWQVLETGKSWAEADADVAEAIDYFEYYAREALRLGTPQRLGNIPGEDNRYFYQPRGVGLVIAPWNFPLAISAGMVSAALVAGNAVLYKPSSLSPVNGWQLVSLLREAGVPAGVLNFVPGSGEVVGNLLVSHPAIAFIAFTGSREVGLSISSRAAEVREGQRCVKKVIAEMGGKNAIIVDADADLDLAVSGVLQSAFGYQGQKCSACSRVIILASCYDRFVERLVEAVKSLTSGPPEDPANAVGPLIDGRAVEKYASFLELARREGKVLVELPVPNGGFYVSPAVVGELSPDSLILREEIFGPLLALVWVESLDEAMDMANASDYALTGGIYSRSPAAIARARRDFRVGNLYINRPITGAIVGRQPFGGFRLSGVGSKAGGPDYLLQFMEPRVVTENTMRRGFSPEVIS